MKNNTTLQNTEFNSLYAANPQFDILTFNFLDKNATGKLLGSSNDSGALQQKLMAYQRVLRLYPDAAVADRLLTDNLDSAVKITNLSQSAFIRDYAPDFGPNGTQIARSIYVAASNTKSQVMHLIASAKNVAASSSTRTMLFNNMPDEAVKTFQDLESYQDFFGNLDYCDCEECRSIFGAAAYLVDLLRIIDIGITQPNQGIQDGLHLFDRRPDIETILLNCENTTTLIPYLQIVNNLMGTTIAKELTKTGQLIGDDVYLTLANTYYPFNLPFHLPLAQIETFLTHKKVSLYSISRELTGALSPITADQAGKALQLSIETRKNLKTPAQADLPKVLSINYGLTITSSDLQGLDKVPTFLQQSGLGLADFKLLLTQNLNEKELFDHSGTYAISAFGPNMILTQQDNRIYGTYGTDGIINGITDGMIVKGHWNSKTQAPPSIQGDFEFTFAEDGKSFTGKWSKGYGMPWETSTWNGTLNGTPTKGIIPHSLFINQTLSDNNFLNIVTVADDEIIAGLDLGTLDHLNRFIRLSALTGWSYVDLNWLLTTLGVGTIDDATFIELARVKQAIDVYGMDLETLCALWFDIRTIGQGNGPVSQAPFDVLFNTPIFLKQNGAAYHPVIAAATSSFVNPLYTDEACLFVINKDLYQKSKPNAATQQLVSIGQMIVNGIPATQDDIIAIARAAFGDVATIQLTVSNLSVLYRHVKLAKQLNTTIDRYIILLKLLKFGTQSGKIFTINSLLNPEQVLQILETSAALQYSGFTVYDVDYVCNQKIDTPVSPYVKNGYNTANIPSFLGALQVVLTGSMCNINSFSGRTISPSDSVQIYNGLTSQGAIVLPGVAVMNSSKVDWSKILVGKKPKALTEAQKAFAMSTLDGIKAHQENLFSNQISAFFGVKDEIATLAIQVVKGTNDLYLVPFASLPNDSLIEEEQTFLLNLSKYLMFQRILALNTQQFSGVCVTPDAFGLAGDNTFSLESVIAVTQLKPTIQAFGDTDNKLVQYFADVWATNPPSDSDLAKELCSITNWDLQQYLQVSQLLMGDTKGCKTLTNILAVKAVFDSANKLGIDTYFLKALNDTTSLEATISNWPSYTEIASKLLLTLQGSDNSDAAQQQYKTINSEVESAKREAMLFFCIYILQATWIDLKTPQNLYEFLLIDPENGGCAEVSLIEEAMNAAQLYLQRCRLNLEKNVHISTDDIPDVWWEWMMSYRVWEANREIFLYPENYLDPTLRKSKTSIFRELENTLQQGEITSDLVESAYIKYLDDFSLFAKLQYVDAYQTIVHDKEKGAVDTLFLFARTQEQPYHFYYITRETVGNCTGDASYLWSEWQNINIKIDAEHITPIYAFNKLFVFWVELTINKDSAGLSGSTGDNTSIQTNATYVTKASIKYSYYNFNGKWIQPQTLVADMVVNVTTSGSNIYGPFYNLFSNKDASYWNRVSVINTQEAQYAEEAVSTGEKIVVYYGPLASKDNLGMAPVTVDPTKDTAAVSIFKETLLAAYFNLQEMQSFGQDGVIPVCPHFIIDETSNRQIIFQQNEFLVLAPDTLTPFRPPNFVIENSNYSLSILSGYNSLVANNSDGLVTDYSEIVTGPQPVSSSSFIVLPYIDNNQSAAIYSSILSNMPGVISSGVITSAALSKTVENISETLNISLDQAQLVQNRFFELYNGSLVLFSDLAHTTSVVPVKNQPNTFILDNSDEAFLITAINNVIEESTTILNPDSFVSSTIDKPTSENYYTLMSEAPNNYINPDGTANTLLVQKATMFSIARLLGTTNDQGQAILTILQQAAQSTSKNIQVPGSKINTNIAIKGLTLAPDSFVTATVDRATSESYYALMSVAPNNYINPDGTVNYQLVLSVTSFAIGHLLGVDPKSTTATSIVDQLKGAANLITSDSFITSGVDQSMSSNFFSILTFPPNNYINPDGTVNRRLLNSATPFSIGHLLDQPATSIAVAKVLYVLNTPGPVVLNYHFRGTPEMIDGESISYEQNNIYGLQFIVERISTGAINQIAQAMSFGGVSSALELDVQQPLVTIIKPFSSLSPTSNMLVAPFTGRVIVPPLITTNQEVSFDGPYGEYYWEVFFHTPFLVAYMLNSNQKFQDAENWMQYIFNPTMQESFLTVDAFVTNGPKDLSRNALLSIYPILTTQPNDFIDSNGRVTSLVTNTSPHAMALLCGITEDQGQEILNLLNNYYLIKSVYRAWQFEPFRNYKLQTLMDNLTSCAQITVYNDDPFDPDAIARLRIGAYEKTLVMRYIDNLLDWGDTEFSQYTWESITMARMYYSYALDLLGPRPVSLGECDSTLPVSFQDIQARYAGGTIPQFLIDMEHLSGNSGSQPIVTNSGKAYNDLGYYFCIPDNDQLNAYWDRIDDRLYKIRHCLNINGVAQPLPLFAPAINPLDLVRAAAQGGNVLTLAGQQMQNLSNYRFSYLIEKARTYTELVSDFGGTLLSVLEKSDAEALANLHLNQSKVILNMTMSVKNKQLESLQNQLSATEESLQSAQNRSLFYTTLLNAGYNAAENAALGFMQASIDVQAVAAGIQGVSVIGYLAPCIFGFSDGGMKFGDAVNMGAQMLQTTSQILTQQGGSLETVAQFQRRAEDWKLQQQIAQYDVSQIQDQILGLQAQIESSQQEIAIQQKTIDQNEEEIAFYKDKFTNQELYQWMIGRVSSVYFQAYKLALDISLKAQLAYQYELDQDEAYITFGYWDSLHQGLLAAEGLKLSLAQLENAFTNNNERRMEIEKTISLKSLNPEAFFAFISGSTQGDLQFSLTEELFDRDFPSHYCRRIKSVSVSVPAVIGPYQNIHATLTQNTNLTVLSANKDAVDYAIYVSAPQNNGQAPNPPNGSIRQDWASSQQIALSKGIDDTGLFTLNYDDPRYLPFEETGAVSTWTLSMPQSTNQIDFNSISDIILTIRYTAKEGGSPFGSDVLSLYKQSPIQYQNMRLNSFDMRQAYASSWYMLFASQPDTNKQQSLNFAIANNVVLPNLSGIALNQIVLQLETSAGINISNNTDGLSLVIGGVSVPVTIKDNSVTLSTTDLSKVTNWYGVEWSLVFTIDKLPELCTNNQLDPAKLTDILLFIGYTSNM